MSLLGRGIAFIGLVLIGVGLVMPMQCLDGECTLVDYGLFSPERFDVTTEAGILGNIYGLILIVVAVPLLLAIVSGDRTSLVTSALILTATAGVIFAMFFLRTEDNVPISGAGLEVTLGWGWVPLFAGCAFLLLSTLMSAPAAAVVSAGYQAPAAAASQPWQPQAPAPAPSSGSAPRPVGEMMHTNIFQGDLVGPDDLGKTAIHGVPRAPAKGGTMIEDYGAPASPKGHTALDLDRGAAAVPSPPPPAQPYGPPGGLAPAANAATVIDGGLPSAPPPAQPFSGTPAPPVEDSLGKTQVHSAPPFQAPPQPPPQAPLQASLKADSYIAPMPGSGDLDKTNIAPQQFAAPSPQASGDYSGSAWTPPPVDDSLGKTAIYTAQPEPPVSPPPPPAEAMDKTNIAVDSSPSHQMTPPAASDDMMKTAIHQTPSPPAEAMDKTNIAVDSTPSNEMAPPADPDVLKTAIRPRLSEADDDVPSVTHAQVSDEQGDESGGLTAALGQASLAGMVRAEFDRADAELADEVEHEVDEAMDDVGGFADEKVSFIQIAVSPDTDGPKDTFAGEKTGFVSLEIPVVAEDADEFDDDYAPEVEVPDMEQTFSDLVFGGAESPVDDMLDELESSGLNITGEHDSDADDVLEDYVAELEDYAGDVAEDYAEDAIEETDAEYDDVLEDALDQLESTGLNITGEHDPDADDGVEEHADELEDYAEDVIEETGAEYDDVPDDALDLLESTGQEITGEQDLDADDGVQEYAGALEVYSEDVIEETGAEYDDVPDDALDELEDADQEITGDYDPDVEEEVEDYAEDLGEASADFEDAMDDDDRFMKTDIFDGAALSPPPAMDDMFKTQIDAVIPALPEDDMLRTEIYSSDESPPEPHDMAFGDDEDDEED